MQPVTHKPQSLAYRCQPCRPVCHSAPPLVPHVDRDPPAHRRAEFSATGGAVYLPPVVTSTCGLPVDNGRYGQPVPGSGEDSNGQCRGQRDVGNTVVYAESRLPAATATPVLHLSDCRTDPIRRELPVVSGHHSRDVKEPSTVNGLSQGRAMVTGVSSSIPSGALGVSDVNTVSDLDRQQYVVTGHSLRPDAAPFVSVNGQPTVQRHPRVNGQPGVYSSCPDMGQWSTVVNVGDSTHLSPVMEFGQPVVGPVVTCQPSMVNGVNGQQCQPVVDPSAVVMVNGMGTGQPLVHQSSASFGGQRQGRDRQQHRHRGHHGGDSPDSSPDGGGTDRSRRPSRHGRDSRDNRQRGDKGEQPSKDKSVDQPGEQPGGRDGDNGQRDNPDRPGDRRRRPDRGGRRGDQPSSPGSSSSSSRSRSKRRR